MSVLNFKIRQKNTAYPYRQELKNFIDLKSEVFEKNQLEKFLCLKSGKLLEFKKMSSKASTIFK